MEVIRNEEKISRNKRISQIASFSGLGILGLGLFISLRGNPEQFLLQWLALLFGIIMWQVSMNFAYKYARSPRPDEMIDEALSGAGFKGILYHFVMPAESVLLTRSGPIVLIPKTQTGTIGVSGENGDRWSRRGSLFKRIFSQEPALGNPTRDAQYGIGQLVNYINENAPDMEEVPVGAIIVFLAPTSELKLETQDSAIPAVHVSTLKKYLRKQLGRPLPPEQFKQLQEIFAAPVADQLANSAETTPA